MRPAVILVGGLLAASAPAPAREPVVLVPEDAALPAVALVETHRLPREVRLMPDGIGLAAAWYARGPSVLLAVPLAGPLPEGAALHLVQPPGAAGGAAFLRGLAPLADMPLEAPVRGPAVALRVPPLASPRAVELEGDLGDPVLLYEGRRIETRSGPVPWHRLAVLPGGPGGTLLLVPESEGGEVGLRAASLHGGYPLPAPEEFRLESRTGGAYAFEVPERPGPAFLGFEAFNLREPGQLRIELEGAVVYTSPAGLAPGRWSEALSVKLPGDGLARRRASLVVFHLLPDRGSEGLPVGIRRLALDEPLPARGPFGVGHRQGGLHVGEVLLSWVPERAVPHGLRFLASELDVAGELHVLCQGVVLGRVGSEGGISQREAQVRVPVELVKPGEPNLLTIRQTQLPWTLSAWSVEGLEIAPEVEPEPVPPRHPEPRPEGPTLSRAPVGLPGSASLSRAWSVPAEPPPLPGAPADPLGEPLSYGIPVALALPGEPPPGQPLGLDLAGAPLAPAPAPATAPPPGSLVDGPVRSHAALSAPPPPPGAPGGDAAPGQPSADRPPLAMGTELPEVPIPFTPARAGAELVMATEPPGAAVFLSSSPGYRGEFLGLTPFRVEDDRRGAARFTFLLPGYHPGEMAVQLAGRGVLRIERSLMPWRGMDFGRPRDVRTPAFRGVSLGYLAPAAADLDGDGRVDLVLGTEKGEVLWARDEGPAGAPRYGVPRPLKDLRGREVAVEGYAAPVSADWDGDGLPDLLVGCQHGDIHLFTRSASSHGIAFEERGLLVADGVAVNVGNDADPRVVDWNGDSSPDLLVGSGYGVIVLYVGIGRGETSQVAPVSVEGKGLELFLDAAPIDYADWTGDGKRDLVVASMQGELLLFPARQEDGRPDFAAPRSVTHRGGLPVFIGTYPRGFALDLDGDGFRDLLFGNSSGEIYWLRGGEPGEFDEIEPIGVPGLEGPASPGASPSRLP